MADVRERLEALSIEPSFSDAASASARIAEDRARWGKLITSIGMKPN